MKNVFEKHQEDMDAVMTGTNGEWLINQWTPDMCVLDSIDPSVLLK